MKNIKLILISTALLMAFSFSHAQNSLTITTVTGGTPGSPISVAINAQLTTPTLSMQFSITYDPVVLQYNSLSNFNSSIPSAISYANPSPGLINVLWTDPGLASFTIATQAKLFDINFTCIDYASGVSPIQFASGTPPTLAPEFYDNNFNQFFPTMANGGLSTTAAPAASTYSGTGNWNVFANWSNGLPGTITNATIASAAVTTITTAAKCNSLTINSTGALTLSSGKTLAMGGTFTIESGGSFIDNTGGSFTGTVKRSMTGNWVSGNPTYTSHLVSSPVANQSNSIFNGSLMNQWNEGTQHWDALVMPYITMGIGTGYAVAPVTGGITANYSGVLNTGNKTISGFTIAGSGSWTGYNLTGNPFPSAMNWIGVTLNNVDPNAWVWDPTAGNYIAYNQVIGGVIGAEQGFFVHANGSGAQITIPNSVRTHSTSFYKSTINDLLTLKVAGNGYSDQTQVYINPMASAGYEAEYDAMKMAGSPEAPQLYSMLQVEQLSINAIPSLNGSSVIQLGFQAGLAGNFSITASGLESFSSETEFFLEDLLANKVQNLKANPVYNFTAVPDSKNEHRFNLHFAPVGVPESIDNNGIKIYSSAKTVYVNIPSVLTGQIVVYDLLGKEIARKQIESSTLNTIDLNVTQGYYLIKVFGNTAITSGKVFIR